MSVIHLIEGPVGAGKSTYAIKLSHELKAARLNLDEWMVTLFSPDRPAENFMEWYNTCKRRCIEQIWKTTRELVYVDIPVVLELGLVDRASRLDFYQTVDDAQCDLCVYVLNAPKKERLQRVRQRNLEQGATYQMTVSDEIFAVADGAWEEPDLVERDDRDIRLLQM